MEIILKEDVVNLGYKNDIVTVKSGYGRNYLIPTGKAVIASPAAKKTLAEELKQRAHKLEKIKKDAEALKSVVGNVTVQRTQFSSDDGDKDDTKAALNSMLQAMKGE